MTVAGFYFAREDFWTLKQSYGSTSLYRGILCRLAGRYVLKITVVDGLNVAFICSVDLGLEMSRTVGSTVQNSRPLEFEEKNEYEVD